jgi:hypothetical protein
MALGHIPAPLGSAASLCFRAGSFVCVTREDAGLCSLGHSESPEARDCAVWDTVSLQCRAELQLATDVRCVRRLLVAACVVPSSPILSP